MISFGSPSPLTRYVWLAPALIVALGLVVWWPTLSYTFFWEDPFDIGQIEGLSVVEMFSSPLSNSYYRPVQLLGLRLLNADGGAYDPLPYRVAAVVTHIAAALLLGWLAELLHGNRPMALLAGLLFVSYPVAFENVARSIAVHAWFAALLVGLLGLYTWGRLNQRSWAVWVALGLAVVAQLMHENGVLIPGFLISLEGWLVWQKRVPRWDWQVLLSVLIAAGFTAIWLSIPKQNSVGLTAEPLGALYLSQSLSYPLVGVLAGLGEGVLIASLSLVATLGILAVAHRQHWPLLLLGLAWWGGALSLAWVTRDIEYLFVSPRVMYLAGIGAALMWAGLLNVWPQRRWAGLTLALVVLALSVQQVTVQARLYQAGSDLMKATIDISQPNARVLYINFPDRFAWRTPMYPLGYWGMLLAPVSQDLSAFYTFTTQQPITSESLSDFLLLSGQVEASPYLVNTRGEDSARSERLYAAVLAAEQVLVVKYAPDGVMGVQWVGDIALNSGAGNLPIAQFAGSAQLLTASELLVNDAQIRVVLAWQSLATLGLDTVVFVHLVGPDGQLVAQADGHSMGGLMPLSAWQPGHNITDVRYLRLPPDAPAGNYRVLVGIYDAATQTRLPASSALGEPIADDAVVVGSFEWP